MKMIRKRIQESIEVKQGILSDDGIVAAIGEAAELCIKALGDDKKLLLCGNGGSAGDAQHIAAELSGRFIKNRKALYAEALHVNSSALTAVANDFGYDEVYARQVEAKGRKGDVLIAISTSGNSPNVVRAIEQAKQQGMEVIGLTGSAKSKTSELCELTIQVPSTDTARIQEAHILIGHIICELVETQLSPA